MVTKIERTHRWNRLVALGTISLVGVIVSPAAADTITFMNGKVLEGEVIGETDRKVFVRRSMGTLSIFKSQLRSIERDEFGGRGRRRGRAEQLFRDAKQDATEKYVYLLDGRRLWGKCVWMRRASSRSIHAKAQSPFPSG